MGRVIAVERLDAIQDRLDSTAELNSPVSRLVALAAVTQDDVPALVAALRAVIEASQVPAGDIESGSGPYGEGWHTGYEHAVGLTLRLIEKHLGGAE